MNTFFYVLNVQTNQQKFVLRSETNTPKALVCAPLVKIIRFALGPIVSEILKNNFFFPTCFWNNSLPWLLDQFFQRVLLLRARRMFLMTVVLPFCIHATIATNTKTDTIGRSHRGLLQDTPNLVRHQQAPRMHELPLISSGFNPLGTLK